MSRFAGTAAALVALLCLVTLAYNSLPTLAQGFPHPVLDTDGKPLTEVARYYILQQPSRVINRGGLTLISRNGSCPLYVGQDPTSSLIGRPVRISLFYVRDLLTIYQSTEVSVSFEGSTSCTSSSTDWAIGQDTKNGKTLITTRGENQPSDPFLIVKEGNHYKLRYCPTQGCGDNKPCRCGDAGIVVENGRRLLAIGVNPALPVVFKRA
ncbi:hypothetical protein Scep_000151 [Stephania cephalantha]|uniref:Uncharacterized protein n=1 Tax=Stephania cephalantha TaxID=152367 RepID=A0AAP0L6I6_9MAGN